MEVTKILARPRTRSLPAYTSVSELLPSVAGAGVPKSSVSLINHNCAGLRFRGKPSLRSKSKEKNVKQGSGVAYRNREVLQSGKLWPR